jgi:hypothetical protein
MNQQLEPIPPIVPARGRSRWRKRLTILGLVLLALGLFVAGYSYLSIRAGHQQLADAVAEADRLDPGWRLEDIDSKRRVVAPEANAANQVVAVRKVLPSSWMKDLELDNPPNAPEPPVQLRAADAASLQDELGQVQPALAEARKLKDLPHGRFPLAYSPGWIGTLIPHVQETRDIANFLGHDVLLRAQQGDIDGAVLSCQALLNTGRALGDEPFLISQLVRIAIRSIALRKLERVLAQGQASPGVLADFQKLLEDEEAQPLLLFGARGERAGMDSLMKEMQKGTISVSQVMGNPSPTRWKAGPIDVDAMLSPLLVGPFAMNHAALLRYLNQVVEIAKQPIEDQPALLKELEATIPDQPALVRLMVPGIGKVGEALRRSTAELRCAIVLLAAERYRLAHGRWPESVGELVPDFLAKVPTDPYNRRPVRLRRLDDGLVIYSVGPDGQDDGGNVNRQNNVAPGSDLGYRLWDVDQRRQPPVNPEVGPPRPSPEEP